MEKILAASASPATNAGHYRQLAARIRAATPALKIQAAQDELLVLAAEYERLAEYVAGVNKLVELLLVSDADSRPTRSLSPSDMRSDSGRGTPPGSSRRHS